MSGAGDEAVGATGRSIDELLSGLGWTEIIAAEPSSSVPEDGRTDYHDELLIDRFRQRVRAINPGADRKSPWLDERRLDLICDHVRRAAAAPGLVEANKAFTELLLQGVVVEGLQPWEGGRNRRVQVVDWDVPENNDLLVVRNFRLDRRAGGVRPVVLDYVLFVNGLPLAVIREPAPDREATIGEAIADLRSYAGTRQDGPADSVPGFFGYAQVLVAADGADRAQVGTVTSAPEHFADWKTVEPASPGQIRAEFGASPERLTSLERAVIGVLRPAHLLDLIRNFTAFHEVDSQVVKLVARYRQFLTVHRIVRRLLTGTPGAPGRRDERGGVVWHTQGSGKSYTMAFLIRKMRSTPALSDFKVVVAVDRTDLRDQLGESLALAGEAVHPAGGVRSAQEMLSDGVPDIVMIMMQHAQRDDEVAARAGGAPERLGDEPVDDTVHFPELTRSHHVVVIIDEAHRTQGGWLRARLSRGLPGAAWIGFTGTPLTSEDRRRGTTTGNFGPFFDSYRLTDAVRDGATVPIRYEQRLADAFVVDRATMDAEYEREVGGSPDDRASRQRWLSARHALESEDLITVKARDMLRHWVRTVLPNGFKAQVAAASRLAAVRYRAALIQVRDELVAELTAYQEAREHNPAADALPDRDFLDDALPFLPLLRIIDFVPVISPGQSRDLRTGEPRPDPRDWAVWTAENARGAHIDRFKERLPAPERIGAGPAPGAAGTGGPPWVGQAGGVAAGGAPWAAMTPDPEPVGNPMGGGFGGEPWREQPDDSLDHGLGPYQARDVGAGPGQAPVAFVIVQNMLLTGFDAPVEQVLYLDRPISGVSLLQAIARVNRPVRQKTIGLIVDYVGVSAHLDTALTAYNDEDLGETKTFLNDDDVPRLRETRDAVRVFLDTYGIDSPSAPGQLDRLLILLEDARLRVEFDRLLGEFFLYLDRVLPRGEALRYENEARAYGEAQYRVRRCFRDTRSGGLDPYTYGAKVRRLIDQHLKAIGIAQRLPPVEITATDFRQRVAVLDNPRVRAMEMEHALRRHVAEQQASDPVYYERLSDRIDQLLEQLRGDAEQLAAALDELIYELRERETGPTDDGLDPRTERPIRSLLEQLLENDTAEIRARTAMHAEPDVLVGLTRDLAAEIAKRVRPPHFMGSGVLQDDLRKAIYSTLWESDIYSEQAVARGAVDLLALARTNRELYLRRGAPRQ